MDTPSTGTFTIDLDEASAAGIARIASEHNVSLLEVIQAAVASYLQQENERRVLEQGASDSLNHYRRTGLHLGHEEVDAWLAEVEAGNFDAELPACHR